MKIIRNYILRESVLPFLLSLGILTCVFLLGNLIQLANMVINKGVSITSIGRIFVLAIPVLLGYTLPIACLISVIMTFSRMSSDNEILAMKACGISHSRLILPIFVLGVILSLCTLILNDRIIPYAHYEQQKAVKNLGVQNPTALLEAGTFIHAFNGQVLFIHKIEDDKLYNITIYQPQENGPTRTIIAKRGEFTAVPGKNQLKIKLMDGTSDEPNLENPNNFYKLNFKNYFITLDLPQEKKNIEKKPKGMTLKELNSEIHRLEILFIETARLKTEFWRKITWSFSPLLFMMIGFPIAVITNRRERAANIVLAIGCTIAYYLIALGCEAISIKEIAPSYIIMWVANAVAAVTALVLNIKCAS